MPFDRPTIPELVTRIATDIDSRQEGTDSQLRRSNTGVLAVVQAGVANGLHGHLEWVARQKFAATADEEALVVDGAQYGLTKKPADFARGTIPVTGENGSVLPVDTLWQRGDGIEYRVTAEATIVDGAANVSIMAVEAGKAGNADPGVLLTLGESVEGINPTAVVGAAGLRMGADIEDLEVFRGRVLVRKRRPPAGGNKYDYVAWAGNISGVLDAWTVSCGQGPGTTDLVVLADAEITGSVVPGAELLATIRAAIVDLAPDNVKFLRVLAPELKELICSLSVIPNTAAVKAAVTAELADLVARAAEASPRLVDPVLVVPLTQINEAISLAAGETNHLLTLPAADFTCSAYQLPVLGEITWL